MTFTITVELLTGSYDAADPNDRQAAEWPPHPARLFCALVAAARSDDDRTALAWLEIQPPPMVTAGRSLGESRQESYVVTNEVAAKGGNLTHPGRSNQLRVRLRSFPAASTVRFAWPAAAPEPAVAATLDALARRVPYLGRSTGIALVSAAAVDSPQPAVSAPGEQSVYEPCDLLDAEVSLRVPYPGYLAELEALFAEDKSAWQANRFRGYRRRKSELQSATPDAVSSVYPDVVVLRFNGLRPEGRLAALFTEALRRTVLGQARKTSEAQVPAVLHGHGAPGRPHVAFLALPDVGGEYADGHLLGLAVAIPELSAPERQAVLAAVLGLRRRDDDAEVIDLDVPGIGQATLGYRPGHVRPWGATPDRWRRGGRTWVTATPVVLDRYPRRREHEVDVILASARMLGLPEVVDARVSHEPLLPGAVRIRPPDLPEQVRGRLYRHVSLTFDRPVAGPLLLGAGRYLGIGLFAPVTGSAQ